MDKPASTRTPLPVPLVGEGEAAPLEAGEAAANLLVLDRDRRKGELRPQLIRRGLVWLAAAAAPATGAVGGRARRRPGTSLRSSCGGADSFFQIHEVLPCKQS